MKSQLLSLRSFVFLGALFLGPLLMIGCTPSKTTSGGSKKAASNLNLNQEPFFLFGSMASLAERDEQALVDAIAKQPELLAVKDDDGRTALHHAAKFYKPKAVSALLKAGADANVSSKWGTPLEMAIDPAHGIEVSTLPVVQMLLEHGADPLLGSFGHSPLLDATEHKDPAVFAAVSGAVTNMTATQVGKLAEHCCREGNTTGLRFALDQGLDVNTNLNSRTALQWAAGNGNMEQVEMLLAAGSDPSTEVFSKTAFHAAVSGMKPVETLRVLFAKTDFDANFSTKGAGGLLQFAVEQMRTNAVKFLLEEGADPDFRVSPNSYSAKLTAFRSGDAEIAKLLKVEARPAFPTDGSKLRLPIGAPYQDIEGYTWPVFEGAPLDIVDTKTDCLLELVTPGGRSLEIKPNQLNVRQYKDKVYSAVATLDPSYSLPELADLIEKQVKAFGGDLTEEKLAALLSEWRAATPQTSPANRRLEVKVGEDSLAYSIKMAFDPDQPGVKIWGLSVSAYKG